MDNLEQIQKEVEEKGSKVGNSRILFLDVSSTCTGYSIAEIDFINKRANIVKAGVLWLDPKWSHQEKYSYLFNAVLTYFEIVEQIDYIVHEAYAVNKNQMSGVMVVIEAIGAIKTAAQENNTKISSITPQTWRKQIGIKPTVTLGSDGKKHRDYKEPCKKKVLEFLTVPEECISNITNNKRQTPSDLYDALGIASGWLLQYGFKVKYNKCVFNDHIGHLNREV